MSRYQLSTTSHSAEFAIINVKNCPNMPLQIQERFNITLRPREPCETKLHGGKSTILYDAVPAVQIDAAGSSATTVTS